MKILHTADLHLKEYEDERWKALKDLIEVGKKEKINAFVISGDLFDKDFNADNLRPKIRNIFSNNDFKVIIIPGNHDEKSYASGLLFGEDVVILNNLDAPFEYENVDIWGMPFENIKSEGVFHKIRLLSKKLKPDKINILLYHGELLETFFSRNDFGDEGEERYMPIKLDYFKGLNINYILAGHFHSNFNSWPIEDKKYFVYPGSPISITKRETGNRKVNLFEVGKPPKEYTIPSPYYEEIMVKLDPLGGINPLEIIEKCLNSLPPYAKIILKVEGFINSEAIGKNETELKDEIKKLIKDRCYDLSLEFSDVKSILENDLFRNFENKLEQKAYSMEDKKLLSETIIEAMMMAKK